MNAPIKPDRSEPETGRLDDEIAALVKGMLARGDKQSDIAACFGLNGGRPSEINTGKRFAHVKPAKPEELPPAAPYPSPYELMQTKRELWRARVALEAARDSILQALVAVHKAEQR